MSYLVDKKIKQKKIFYLVFFVIFFALLFFFRSPIFKGFSYASHFALRPVLGAGRGIGEKFSNAKSYFVSKNSLALENQILRSRLEENEARMSNYNSVVADNNTLKEIFGRKNTEISLILSAILAKPNQSPYDTLVIDAGQTQGLKMGDTVFALGNIPVGTVAETYPNSSKVVLFSSSGEKTQVVVPNKNIFLELVGRGGGNFEMILPRDLLLVKGDQVVLPGITPYVLGVVETIISDPREYFGKALLTSPVNIQELKFVQVEI